MHGMTHILTGGLRAKLSNHPRVPKPVTLNYVYRTKRTFKQERSFSAAGAVRFRGSPVKGFLESWSQCLSHGGHIES